MFDKWHMLFLYHVYRRRRIVLGSNEAFIQTPTTKSIIIIIIHYILSTIARKRRDLPRDPTSVCRWEFLCDVLSDKVPSTFSYLFTQKMRICYDNAIDIVTKIIPCYHGNVFTIVTNIINKINTHIYTFVFKVTFAV